MAEIRVLLLFANGGLIMGRPKGLKNMPVADRIARVLARYVVTGRGCWEWQGGKNQKGYGLATVTFGRNQPRCVAVHRLSYEHHKGPIPDGAMLLHLCDNPACINPDHLEPGTARDNARDMMRRGRAHWQRGKPEADFRQAWHQVMMAARHAWPTWDAELQDEFMAAMTETWESLTSTTPSKEG